MIRRVIRIKETIATVMAEEEFISVAETEIRLQRRLMEEYLAAGPAMLTALKPYKVAADAPAIVQRMAAARARAGDLALLLAEPVMVNIFTGPAEIKNIGQKCRPRPEVFGVCTSLGTVGHSLSFSRADAAVVVSRDVCLADALATALCDAVQEAQPQQIRKAKRCLLLPEAEGLLVAIDDLLCLCGNLPEVVSVHTDLSKISA